MSNIYTSSFIDGPELNSKNLLQSFEEYASKLEEMAKSYKKIVKLIRTKKIKILEAQGYPHGGFFRVDDIDTNRLKQAGAVTDFSDELEKKEDQKPVFYIDTEFEEVMEELHDESCEMHPHKMEIQETEMFSSILEPDFEIPEVFEVEINEDPFTEKDTCFSLKEVFSSFEEDEDIKVGQVGIEIEQIDETKFNFNLTIADLNKNPTLVQFDRERCVFKYQCGACDSWHYETLESVYRSLKTANALFSNLMVMAKDCKELLAAFDFVDHDLRLLQALLRFDYALEDEEDFL